MRSFPATRRHLLTLVAVGMTVGTTVAAPAPALTAPAGARTAKACEVPDAETRAQDVRPPAGLLERCVFRRPFREEEWLSSAGLDVDLKYALLNYDENVRGSCAPAQPARDESGRAGWLRVVCTITLTGQTGTGCDPRCTGTIWQFYGNSDDPKARNLGAKRLRFRVVFVKSQAHCARVPRVWQLPPFKPRLKRSPLIGG
jgi:hypothetical protein